MLEFGLGAGTRLQADDKPWLQHAPTRNQPTPRHVTTEHAQKVRGHVIRKWRSFYLNEGLNNVNLNRALTWTLQSELLVCSPHQPPQRAC